MEWDVIHVKPIAPWVIRVEFADGTVGNVQFKKNHLTGVFEGLNDHDFFQKVFIDDGVVTWPGNIDLAPDAMYLNIKTKGEWILQ